MRISVGGFGLALLLSSSVGFANGGHNIDVQPLNSPVKESLAKFQLTLPSGTNVSKVLYRLEEKEGLDQSRNWKNDRFGRLKKAFLAWLKYRNRDKWKEATLVSGPQGLEAHVPVSDLPPGSFTATFDLTPKRPLVALFMALFGRNTPLINLKGRTEFLVDESLEVADPGPAGTTTLAGVDSDGDGVRDDVQRWINESYSSSVNQKSGLKQRAHAFQSTLLTTEDRAASIQASAADLRAAECVDFVMGSFQSGLAVQRELKAKILNTRERTLANFKASENFNGQKYRLARNGQEAMRCNFSLSP
jgi:hypothetical protein